MWSVQLLMLMFNHITSCTADVDMSKEGGDELPFCPGSEPCTKDLSA